MSQACPISFQTIDENQARIHAAVITALSVLFLATGWSTVLLFIAYDYIVRIAALPKLSPIYSISKSMVEMCNITPAKTDAAPKLFAAQIGLAFSLIASVLYLGNYEVTALSLVAVLTVCAFFEAALNFCAGCWFYSILNRLNIQIVSLKD